MKNNLTRIHLIDTLRGIAIIAMVFHHVGYLLESFYGVDNFYTRFFYTDTFDVLQFVFVALFILICGISCNFSRNNLKRGLICLACGVVVTVATLIITPEWPTFFGILQFMGTSMIIYSLIQPLLQKASTSVWCVIFTLLFAVNYALYIRFEFHPAIKTDAFFIFGVISSNFKASDYYPLLPYLWLFLVGALLGKYIVQHKAPKWVYDTKPVPVITWVGRHTLWVYVLHMPLAFLIAQLLVLIGVL